MISLKAQYALRALLALAKTDPDELSLIAEIAEAQRIPKKFLEQILLDLKHHGIVASRRGKLGRLFAAPAGGPDHLRRGVADHRRAAGAACRASAGWPTAAAKVARRADLRDPAVMARVAEATRGMLDSVTIADAMARPERVALAVS